MHNVLERSYILDGQLTLYTPGEMHEGKGQFRCFTVLPDSCVSSADPFDTVKFELV